VTAKIFESDTSCRKSAKVIFVVFSDDLGPVMGFSRLQTINNIIIS